MDFVWLSLISKILFPAVVVVVVVWTPPSTGAGTIFHTVYS